jgi:hypothetical protein
MLNYYITPRRCDFFMGNVEIAPGGLFEIVKLIPGTEFRYNPLDIEAEYFLQLPLNLGNGKDYQGGELTFMR